MLFAKSRLKLIKENNKTSIVRSVAVYCGSSPGNRSTFLKTAENLGKLLGSAKITLVYGGGRTGLMGAVADGALSSGGDVIGVIPDFLIKREVDHPDLTKLIIVKNMHARKQKMFELSDGFIILPGGVGTLDEALEIITWQRLGVHKKPILIVNVDGYWQPLIELINTTIQNGFSSPQTSNLFKVTNSIDDIVNILTDVYRQK